MQFVEAGDLKICCELKGSGYPLVMIMGFSGNMDWWEPEFIDALAAKYRVLVFDNRGAGRTVTPPEGDFTLDMFADDTALLMEKLGIDRANVFGFSMGGIIAQALALRHPEKVNRLVLGGTFCGGKETVMPTREVSKILADSSGGIDEVCARTLKLMFPEKFISGNPGFAAGFVERCKSAPITAHNARRQLVASMKTGTWQRLPEIKIPVLVATGTEDILISPENSHILAERIPGAELVEYAESGHCFMSTAREKCLNDMTSFFDR
ncbi:MAG TPA: alpha/beta hydrolase [Spirochaetota bacterium]|nr:alpha/beta hydrolase [Spirochaetota bacterium]